MAAQIRRWLPSRYSELPLHVTMSAASLFPHVGVPVMVRINLLVYRGIVTLIFHTPFPPDILGPATIICMLHGAL